MSVKSSTVMARVEPDIKDKAEEILATLGVSSSGLINMLYRQIILTNGIPFSITIPRTLPNAEDMTDIQMDAMLEKGLAQAKEHQGVSLDDAFTVLESSIG